MPPLPKIHTNSQVELLRKCYIDDKMSTVDISAKSKDIFGMDISVGTIYRELMRHHIPVRSKSDSISMASSTLNANETYLNEEMIEWIDGFLLGDGGINFSRKAKTKFLGSRFHMGSIKEEWIKLGMSKFNVYGYRKIGCSTNVCKRRPNPLYYARTLTHPDILKQSTRWYGQGSQCTKDIPDDVRITPVSMLLWYLGDGSISRIGISFFIRLATCAFSPEKIDGILIPKLEKLGLKVSRDVSKNDIRICASSVGRFFDIIGHKSPIACYAHKFVIPDWLYLIRLSDIVENDRQKYMALYYYRTGQLECSKSPGGGLLLFTKDQANKLKEKLKS